MGGGFSEVAAPELHYGRARLSSRRPVHFVWGAVAAAALVAALLCVRTCAEQRQLGVRGDTTGSVARAPRVPDAITRDAESVGLGGASLNGRVHPHGRPGVVRFEHGATPALGASTPPRPLPPELGAHYRESWNEGLGGWTGGMSGKDLVWMPSGGHDGGAYVRYVDPGTTGDDGNHFDGVGFVHLVQYIYPGTFLDEAKAGQAYWGGGDPDLRGAKVSMWIRGVDWKPKGTELSLWVQSDLDLVAQNQSIWRRSNWAYTGVTLHELLRTGAWERAEYTVVNDTTAWSYGGNYVAQGRPNYVYQPLDDALAHANCDVFHMLTNVTISDQPSGAIELDELTFTYRNHNLLRPSHGGRLVSATGDADADADDANKLVDGWRNGEGHAWRSGPRPKAPQEITFALAEGAHITTLLVAQSPEWPSKDVEILASHDGRTWGAPIARGRLAESVPQGANFNLLRVGDLDARPAFLRVRILSGYRERWGLGEVEAFGDGVPTKTEDDWYDVNADVSGLTPGSTLFYRVVLEQDGATEYGEVRSFAVPATPRPQVTTGPASRMAAGTAKAEARVHPMGLETQLAFEYGPDTSYGQTTDPVRVGLQQTPRHVAATLVDLTPGQPYHYRAVASSPAGVTYGHDATFVAR